MKFNMEEALKSGFYISGTTGCGKTDVGMYCADDLRSQGITVFVFDPSQDWIERYPIRNRVSFSLITDDIDLGFSDLKLEDTIFDTSRLTTLQFQQLVENFSKAIYLHQAVLKKEERKFCFPIFEEAHTVLPEGVMKSKTLQNLVRLITVGRNYKIRVGMITQFAAMLDKSALRYMGQRYFGWTDEYNDVHRIGTMIGFEESKALKFLKSGEFLYYCPSLHIQEKVSIEPYKSILPIIKREKNPPQKSRLEFSKINIVTKYW
jgi:DNA helicase HerA-like ATPase